MKKLAVFDIGSNAVRMGVAQLDNLGHLTITKRIRVPLRLGSEAFQKGSFSDYTINYAAKVFQNFRKILDQENVTEFRAVATSAFRNAENKEVLSKKVFEESGILIEEITGDLEANLIRNALETQIDLKQKCYLLVDIGGGSTELSIMDRGKLKGSKSFPIGTVRMLEAGKGKEGLSQIYSDLVGEHKAGFQKFLKSNTKDLTGSLRVIGTGGNFKRLLKLRKKALSKKNIQYMYPDEIMPILRELESTPFLQRMKKFSLRPDRADVIIPAIYIILGVLEGLPVKKIYSPDIGLLQGVLFDMLGGQFENVKVLKED